MRACQIEGCRHPYRAKGLCQPHYAQKWQRDNAVKCRAKNKRWRQANPESVRAHKRRWYHRHIQVRRLKSLEWQRTHPDLVRARHQRRRAAKNNVCGGHFTARQFRGLVEKYDRRCVCCLRTIAQIRRRGQKIVADHVIPLVWGKPRSNEIGNIQPLCSACNSSKGARHATDYRPTFQQRLDIFLKRE